MKKITLLFCIFLACSFLSCSNEQAESAPAETSKTEGIESACKERQDQCKWTDREYRACLKKLGESEDTIDGLVESILDTALFPCESGA